MLVLQVELVEPAPGTFAPTVNGPPHTVSADEVPVGVRLNVRFDVSPAADGPVTNGNGPGSVYGEDVLIGTPLAVPTMPRSTVAPAGPVTLIVWDCPTVVIDGFDTLN